MIVPDDLIIDIGQQKITLRSGRIVVTIANEGRYGPFARGPMYWKDLVKIYLAPALERLQSPVPVCDTELPRS